MRTKFCAMPQNWRRRHLAKRYVHVPALVCEQFVQPVFQVVAPVNSRAWPVAWPLLLLLPRGVSFVVRPGSSGGPDVPIALSFFCSFITGRVEFWRRLCRQRQRARGRFVDIEHPFSTVVELCSISIEQRSRQQQLCIQHACHSSGSIGRQRHSWLSNNAASCVRQLSGRNIVRALPKKLRCVSRRRRRGQCKVPCDSWQTFAIRVPCQCTKGHQGNAFVRS